MRAALAHRPDVTAPASVAAVAVRVHRAPAASRFTRRLVAALAADLGGEEVEGLPQHDARAGAGAVAQALVVAPHEFLAGRPWAARRELAAAVDGAVVISTAELSEHLGGVVAPWLTRAASVLDPAAAGVAGLGRAGVPVRRLPLGWVPGAASARPHAERPLAAATWALATPHRLRTLARCGRVLAGRRVLLDVRQALPPAGHERPLDPEPAADDLAATRVVLWVPESPGRALPWRVVLGAAAAGAVVLTEHPADVEPLHAGTNLVVGAPASVPFLLDALLRDPGRAEAMAASAVADLRERRPWADALDAVRTALDDSHSGTGRRRPSAPPVEAALPPATADRPGDGGGRDDAVLRRLVLDVAALRREVRRLEAARVPAEPARWSTPAWEGAAADLSVVVTLYDYAETVVEALDSVTASEDVTPEIVVVDDASEDDSVTVVRGWLEAHPDVAATLVARPVNAGVAAARNLGVAVARAGFVLPLDADDRLYPRGLARLRAALEGDPHAAFAYGIVEQADDRDSYGLLAYGPWEPGRLASGNYITSVALLRRATLDRLGGWDDRHPLLLAAWEDYDLWLRCAAAGLHAAHVPEIVAWYRQGPSSRDRLSELLSPAVTQLLRRRYPGVLARHDAEETPS